jgi:hypothetical protein
VEPKKFAERQAVNRKFNVSACQIGSQLSRQHIGIASRTIQIAFVFSQKTAQTMLKTGKFRASYLGQLNLYLSALDEYVRKPHENPSIGIILCKEMNRTFVQFAVRDYTKPMGVATYRTSAEMPEKWRKALPDIDEMRKLL